MGERRVLIYHADMIEAFLLLFILAFTPLFRGNVALLGIATALVFLLFIQFLRLVFTKSPPFVPTSGKDVRTMVELAGIRQGDRVSDLGCGDGRIVRAAATKGAEATGYELSVPTYLFAKLLSLRTPNARIRFGDFWKTDFSDQDVLFCFLLKKPMRRFQEAVWPTLKPGSRVVSYMFRMPDVPVAKQEGLVFLYVK